MAIYSLDDLRAAVPSDMRSLSDDELVRDYSQRIGRSFEDTANYLGMKPRGTAAEVVRQLGAGAAVDLPKMIGQGLQYTGFSPEAGAEMVRAAEARAPGWAPDMRGRGLVGEALITGARAVAPMAPAIGASFLPGGQWLAPTVAAGLFGTSAAQETYEKLVGQGIPEDEAAAAARRVGMIQGPAEGIATAVGLRAMRPLATALGKATTTAGVAGALTETAVAKPFLKGMATNMVVQPATEVAQDVGTSLVEQAYGARPEDLGEIARQSALGGAGLTMLLGPLSLGGHVMRSHRAESLKQALYGEDTPPEVRSKAINLVMGEARRQGVAEQDVGAWFSEQMAAEDARNEALRAAAEQADQARRTQQINLLGEQAQGLTGLQGGMFSSLEQQRTFEQGLPNLQFASAFESPEQQRAAQLGYETMRDRRIADVGQQYQDLMASRASTLMQAQDLGQQAQEVMAPQARGLESAQQAGDQWQELRAQQTRMAMDIDEMGQEWQKLQAELPQPITGNLTNAQKAALRGPAGKRLKKTSEPIAPVAGGPMATSLVQAPQAAVSQLPAAAPVAGPVSQLTDRPSSPVSAPEVAAVSTPAAPAAAGGSLETPMAPQEQRQLQSLIDAADKTAVGNVLPSSVQGANTVKAPGKASLTDQQLRKIRDALVHGREAAGEQENRIVAAMNNFAEAYKAFLDKGGNRLLAAKDRKRAGAVDASFSKLQLDAANARAALAELGEAVGGNAKNVEAVVRLVKDMVQGKIVTPGRTRAETIAAAKKLDTMLSQGWAAAKREVFLPEQPDLADVRGSESRQSREVAATGEMSPVEKAATEGVANPKGKGDAYFGLKGVLQYIRNTGTPMERQLAWMLREALDAQMNDVKLVFIDSGNSRFDPATNTVYLSRTSSPEVSLHEAFHAALQSFVYKNPNDPAVQQLKRSLKSVVNYKGELTGKAKEVQDLLKKLVADKKELDAVLELVSYGTTLNDFRRALQAMPSKGVPASFREAATRVWTAIKNIASRMLGDKPSVASDVLQSSVDLLERAGKQPVEKGLGNVLEAAVQTTKPLSDAKAAEALGMSEQDYSRWSGSNLINMLPTQRLFEAVGWSEANAKKFVGKAGDKFAKFISKNFPGAEIALGLINSRYAVSSTVSQTMDRFKLDKGIGYQYAEDLANVISRRPAAEVNALFAYLDGNKKALDSIDNSAKLKAEADKLKEWFDAYVAELSEVEQKYFHSRKFTETLLFPERTEQVAGGTFGLGKINEVLGLKRKSETELDQNWFTKDANGDLVLDGDMYQVFKVDNTVKPGVPEGAGFMSAARFAELGGKNPVGYSVDTSRKWLHEGASDQGHSFITNTTARDKVENQKADDVANALRNTVAALANNYASKHFIKSVYGMGRGDSPHAQVAFDSLADVNKEYGTSVTEDKVLKASYEMSRSPQTASLYRQSGTWVQLPDSKVYGDLAGKYIPGPVWNAMVDMSDRQPLVNVRAINNTMRWFKKSKTIWNPGTHVTNAASNVTLAMMHDISFGTMSDAAKLLAKYETSARSLTPAELKLMMAFRDSGAMLADYSSAEVKEALYKAHADNLRGGEDLSVARRVAGWLNIEKSKAEWLKAQASKVGKGADYVDGLASQMYAAEDNLFRLAAFLKTAGALQTQAGLKTPTPEMLQEAGKFARTAFGDYDIDSKAVKVARQTVMPFISWFYAMAPVLGRIAVYQPWKFANVLAAYALIEGAMGAAGGGDDDELRKQGPESIRERMFFGTIGPYMHIRIPFMGDDQNPVYYKLGDYFPMASMTKGLPNGFMGQSWFPGGLTPSGPFVSGVAGLVLGVDPYTGKSIHQPTDTDWGKLWNATKFGYDIATPPAVSSRQISKVDDILEGKTGITGAEPSALPIARTFGLKLYDFNVDEQAAINDIVVKRIQRDFKSAMTKAKRDEMRKGYPDFEALDAELDDLRTRMEKEIERARGGSEE